ncbi:MAG: putative toxin-antitoxin system toxin component, PIN family [Acidobacteria bacterium]|nr:putative toxin-antitoxin system toxin component, PIN family [Acidobacteriota bacterium]
MSKVYQVVLDTNVLVAALRSRQGASHRLLRLVGDPRWQINLSVPLVLEYEDVLKRPNAGHPLSPDEVDDVLNYLCASASLREIFYLWRPMLPDPKDDFVLELAVESGCDYVVTFNTRDFAGAEKFGVLAIRPQELLRVLGEIP